MTALIILMIVVFLIVIAIQVGKVNELAGRIRGEEETFYQGNDRTGLWLFIFMILFLFGCVASAWYYKDVMLGYGPLKAASAHGDSLDSLFNVTLFFTGIVFIVTQYLLFWFSYKYRAQKGRKAYFFPHNTNLEIIWTVIPAIVMTYLVVKGLVVWNTVMPDVDPNATDYMEIEATGYQFAWDIRYPGADGKLGTRNFTEINPASNPLGQVWTDVKNHDDFIPSEIVLPKGQKVRVRITAKDVLHNFYLPHFRVKMDAIPGLPTYFIFTPIKTTEEFRQELRKYPEWQQPYDPTEPDGLKRWEDFNYELACAELCGEGHYSMKKLVKIVEQDEYDAWLAEQNSYYLANIRESDADPFKGQLLDVDVRSRNQELTSAFEDADEGGIIQLKNVFFNTGSATLKDDSRFELSKVAELMNKYASMKIEVGGHTDSQGDDNANMSLSVSRAQSVLDYLVANGVSVERLVSKGYGELNPAADNETPEGRKQNRRTELKILSK